MCPHVSTNASTALPIQKFTEYYQIHLQITSVFSNFLFDSSLFGVSVVDISIDSAFAKDDIGGDDTADEAFEAVMTLELAEFDEELFETEIAVVA